MKAIRYYRYGPPDVLELRDIDRPAVGDDEVLVRVRAASVNPLGWHFMRGTPYLVRAIAGLSRPKASATRLGADMAGVLVPTGVLVAVGGPNKGRWLEPLGRSVGMVLLSPTVSQRMTFFLAHLNRADLAVLRELLEAGKVRPVIDRTYPLGECAAAIGYLEQGHAVGKVAITV